MDTPCTVLVVSRTAGRSLLLILAVITAGCQPKDPGLAADLPGRLGYSVSADESFVNDCGDRVTASVRRVSWGPGGAVWMALIPAGQQAPSCYGDGPGLVTLWSHDASDRQPLISHRGPISLLSAPTATPARIALGGAGTALPLLEWTGREFAPTGRTVDDVTFNAGIVLP